MSSLSPALANILHLLELPEQPAIGHVGLAGTGLAAVLATIASRVVDVGAAEEPLAPASLDVVLQGEGLDSRALGAVRPGGWLVMLRSFAGRRPRSHPVPHERAQEVRRWLVSPGFHFPYAIVPDTRVALRSHELYTREAGWKRTVRLAALNLGWPAREFTGEVVAVRIR